MTIMKNRVVSIDYTISDEKNNLIDSTRGAEPLEYLHGFENILPGLERALEGKALGDHFSVKIPAAEAYGERDENLITEIPLECFDEEEELQPGVRYHTQTSDGILPVMVTAAGDSIVTIDGNHPLAGLNLNFDIIVTAIREAGEEELSLGHPHWYGQGCKNCKSCQGCEYSQGCEGCSGH